MAMSVPTLVPFTIELLDTDPGTDPLDLLPASLRSSDDELIVPSTPDKVLGFLSDDLSTYKLRDIHHHLWMAGRPMPPRHLGHQETLSREIIISEEIDLHLVWKTRGIYIKPLPRYLLSLDFWNRYILSISSSTAHTQSPTPQTRIEACAKGFLLSYCALIVYESDLRLAKEIGLLPAGIDWKHWRTWVAQVLHNCPYKSVDTRFWYGELRLSRLNLIYRWRKGFFLHGYTHVGAPSDYSEFLSDNFSALAAGLGFFVVILTAMQVGLATGHLQRSLSFQAASWVFTIFSIVTSLATFLVVIMVFLVAFTTNWVRARQYWKERMAVMGVCDDERQL